MTGLNNTIKYYQTLRDDQPAHNPPAVRTLVVSWHWPPTARASAGVLGSLFQTAPKDCFRVVTRAFPQNTEADQRPTSPQLIARVPRVDVPWPMPESIQPGVRHCPMLLRTFKAMVDRGTKAAKKWNAQRILAVYPHRLSLLAGWRIARRLDLPLVLYMHDLFAEATRFRNPVKRRFWNSVDRRVLKDAWMTIVPTEEFAEHYRMRGIVNTWVLPHCIPSDQCPSIPAVRNSWSDEWAADLKLIYSGAIYEPHEDAARALVDATRGMEGVEMTYHTNPAACDGLLGRVGAKWVSHDEANKALKESDVAVVVLGKDTPCPEEVQGCFPSKIIDALKLAKPILAIVPSGSFVHRFIRTTRCGMAVTEFDTSNIRAAIDKFRDPHTRRQMSLRARDVAFQLESERWMQRLVERLSVGPATASSHPPFPSFRQVGAIASPKRPRREIVESAELVEAAEALTS